MDEDYESMSYKDVQKCAGSLGLNKGGKKVEIIQRIREHFEAQQPPADTTVVIEPPKTPESQIVPEQQDQQAEQEPVTPKKGKKGGSKKKTKKSDKPKTPSPLPPPRTIAQHEPTQPKTPVQTRLQQPDDLSLLTDDNSSFDLNNSKLTCETVKINADLKSNARPMIGSTPINNFRKKRSISASNLCTPIQQQINQTYDAPPQSQVAEPKHTSEQKQADTVAVDEPAPKPQPDVRQGRARIVKPIVNGVEVRQRSAGPTIYKPDTATASVQVPKKLNAPIGGARITKPTDSSVEPVKKKVQANSEPAKQPHKAEETNKQPVVVKPTGKTPGKKPDFKAIHEKLANNMESIDDNRKRLQDRHDQNVKQQVVQGKGTTPSRPATSIPRFVSKVVEQAASQTPSRATSQPPQKRPMQSAKAATTEQKTPKPAVLAAQVAKPAVEPKTPKPVVLGVTKAVDAPKTPKQPIARHVVAKENKTPRQPAISETQAKTPKPLLASGVTPLKKPKATIVQSTQFQLAAATSALNQTQQLNTFSRRKSFDLNASLSRPLSYNPHCGKIKPVKFDSKSIFVVANKQANANQSMNTSRAQVHGANILHESNKFKSSQNTRSIRSNENKIRKSKKDNIVNENRNMENEAPEGSLA